MRVLLAFRARAGTLARRAFSWGRAAALLRKPWLSPRGVRLPTAPNTLGWVGGTPALAALPARAALKPAVAGEHHHDIACGLDFPGINQNSLRFGQAAILAGDSTRWSQMPHLHLAQAAQKSWMINALSALGA